MTTSLPPALPSACVKSLLTGTYAAGPLAPDGCVYCEDVRLCSDNMKKTIERVCPPQETPCPRVSLCQCTTTQRASIACKGGNANVSPTMTAILKPRISACPSLVLGTYAAQVHIPFGCEFCSNVEKCTRALAEGINDICQN